MAATAWVSLIVATEIAEIAAVRGGPAGAHRQPRSLAGSRLHRGGTENQAARHRNRRAAPGYRPTDGHDTA